MVLKKKNKEFYLQNVYSFVIELMNKIMGDFKYETIKNKRFVINKNYRNFSQMEQFNKTKYKLLQQLCKAKEHHRNIIKY